MTAAAKPVRVTLNGIQKAAVLCMALGPDASSEILRHLGPDEMEAVSREIARTPSVKPELMDQVLDEYRNGLRASADVRDGGVTYARQILETAVGPQRARNVIERIQEPPVPEPGLAKLKQVTPDALTKMLGDEHPQTIALVLAHVDPRLAAAVIQSMEDEAASDALYRMARMDQVDPDVLQMVEAVLSSTADLSLTQQYTSSGGPGAVAKLLVNLKAAKDKPILAAIGARGAELAAKIKELMFVFEDLTRLDGRAMQRVLREVDGKTLALAMKACSEELSAFIFKNMSERAAGTLREEMEMLGAVRVKDVEAAHASIVATTRDLQEQGEIVIEMATDDDLIG